ncbi:MAG TPA: carboxyl transferase domain-containing protein [Trebonia sp.]|nr:carboxyl transferase domain-containing protein [Trebonia sp.]HUN33883.1 carboxyl transferase domain-containing protein [Trebonia sp.]
MSHATAKPARPSRPTLREHIERLADPGTYTPAQHFSEGMDLVSEADGGEALIGGRPVTVGLSGHLVMRALNRRQPYVAISSGTGGLARGGRRNLGVLDTVWGMSGGPMLAEMASRRRDVPVVSAIVHHSFGDSSFFTGMSDYVVQLKGACMALTGPRVLAIGTSEQVTMEELGGVDVHARNGQADTIAETLDEVYAAIRRFLSFLPTAAGAPLPVTGPGPGPDREPEPGARQLIDGLCDRGSFFELRRDFAPSLVTGLARLDGIPVGVLASEPAVDDGAFSADACLKATRLVCTCDAFGLPIVFGIDSPGPRVEGISRAMMLAQAIQLAEVPKCWVITGRAHGTGLLVTGPARIATDLVIAWPGARAGYDGAGPSAADEEHWAADGIVSPAGTRAALSAHLRAVLGPAPVSRPGRTLCTWPAGF